MIASVFLMQIIVGIHECCNSRVALVALLDCASGQGKNSTKYINLASGDL